MKLFFPAIFAALIIAGNVLTISSCAGTPAQEPESVPALAVPETSPAVSPVTESRSKQRVPKQKVPEQKIPEQGVPERLGPPDTIMGKGLVPQEQLSAFLLQSNAGADNGFVRSLSTYYVEEAAAEGVNHDTAFAQMCLETGFLRYGGLVTPDMNNFCGLGATGPGQHGHSFPDPRTGVRAHIQHLKAYATTEPLNNDLVDPRYRYVKQGSSPTIYGLSGTWAADRSYSDKISGILQRLYEFTF